MRAPSSNPITLYFGSSESPYSESNKHKGLDYSYLPDDIIYAPADAVVRLVPNNGRDGNGLYFNAEGCFVGLLHTSEYLVGDGAFVQAGQPIARMGATGFVTGKHLHMAVKQGNSFIDPLSVIDAPSGGGEVQEDMISDVDNEYNRWNALFVAIRGRQATREEFQASAVGRSWLNAMEILQDDQEATNAQHAQEVGQLAITDNWQQQIYNLQDQLRANNDTLNKLTDKANLSDGLQKTVTDLQAENQKLLTEQVKLTGQVKQTVVTQSLLRSILRALKRVK